MNLKNSKKLKWKEHRFWTLYNDTFRIKNASDKCYLIKTNGYGMFLPKKLVIYYAGNLVIRYYDGFKVTVFRSKKVDGKFVRYDVKEVEVKDLDSYFKEQPLIHVPKKLEPVESNIIKELIDE